MAARFPASASMQKMANNPQQASLFQRSQFQQSPYGIAVSFWMLDSFVSPLNSVKPRCRMLSFPRGLAKNAMRVTVL